MNSRRVSGIIRYAQIQKSFGAGKTKNINRIVKVGYSHLFLMRDYENTIG
jgi:hypothetical protein